MTEYRIEALTTDTWDAFVRLMERHNGVFDGHAVDKSHCRRGVSAVALNGTRELVEEAGFDYIRPKGATNSVIRRDVEARVCDTPRPTRCDTRKRRVTIS